MKARTILSNNDFLQAQIKIALNVSALEEAVVTNLARHAFLTKACHLLS